MPLLWLLHYRGESELSTCCTRAQPSCTLYTGATTIKPAPLQIIWDLTAVKKTSEFTTKQVLPWAWRVEVHKKHSWKPQKMIKNLTIWKGMNKGIIHSTKQNQIEETLINCKYFKNSHMPRRCPANGKRFSWCDKANYFEKVWRARTERPLEVITDKELFVKCVKTMTTQRWQPRSLIWQDQNCSMFTALDQS